MTEHCFGAGDILEGGVRARYSMHTNKKITDDNVNTIALDIPISVFPVFVTTEILGNNGIHGNFFFLFFLICEICVRPL